MFAVDLNWWNVVLGVMCSLGFIAGFVFAIVKWASHGIAKIAVDKSGISDLTKELHEAVSEIRDDTKATNARLDKIESQYRNNGGSSARDLWDRIEENLRHIRSDISRVDKAVERHLGFHDGSDD